MVAVMAGAPDEPGRQHECGRMLGWGPGRKVPARAPQPEVSRSRWPLGNVVPSGPVAQWREKKKRGRAATRNARLPVVALGPEPSGLGPTRAFARIHAGAPAQLGRPPLRRPYRGPKRKKARDGD
ncbi:hypothetical protein NDU88_001811 [Pleurodeles waltl]|uniref:Uncharacterized protein n=1 Tax=Pleurodeles waltl TaxID=8319 RepID=A0AAV7NFV8_PLEWA|nr:hypothetical protein NDU88_001811 [Pleurodeles waltl]